MAKAGFKFFPIGSFYSFLCSMSLKICPFYIIFVHILRFLRGHSGGEVSCDPKDGRGPASTRPLVKGRKAFIIFFIVLLSIIIMRRIILRLVSFEMNNKNI